MAQMTAFSASDHSLIARTADLVPFRRGGRWLVLAPRSGASIMLEGDRLKLFGTLGRPQAVARVHELNPGLPEFEIKTLLHELHAAGMLEVAGRSVPSPAEPDGPLVNPPRLTLRLTEGCSPSCPSCAALSVDRPVLAVGEAVQAVEACMECLPNGPVHLDVSGGEPLLAPEALEAAVRRALELRPDLLVSVRTGGWLLDSEKAAWLAGLGASAVVCLHEAPGQAGLLAERAAEALHLLPQALATGLSWAPVGVVRRPGQALDFYNLFMGLRFRTMRLVPVAPSAGQADRDAVLEALGDDFLAVADAVRDFESRVPIRVQVHPLEVMVARLASGRKLASCGHLQCGSRTQGVEVGFLPPATCPATTTVAAEVHPRCPRCPFWRVCGGGCSMARQERELDALCRFWLKTYEGLLWRMHEDPAWTERHRQS